MSKNFYNTLKPIIMNREYCFNVFAYIDRYRDGLRYFDYDARPHRFNVTKILIKKKCKTDPFMFIFVMVNDITTRDGGISSREYTNKINQIVETRILNYWFTPDTNKRKLNFKVVNINTKRNWREIQKKESEVTHLIM